MESGCGEQVDCVTGLRADWEVNQIKGVFHPMNAWENQPVISSSPPEPASGEDRSLMLS